MMHGRLEWHGDEQQAHVRLWTWKGLVRAASYFHSQVLLAISKSYKLGKGTGAENWPNPASPPGGPPGVRTGHGRANILMEQDEPNLTIRVGVGANAIYMLFLELGTKGGRILRAGPGKVIPIVTRSGDLIFRKWVRQGAIKPRPFLMSTLTRVWQQVCELAGSGE